MNIWKLIYLNCGEWYTFYGYITNSQSGQLPVGFIAQSVEHCTGIAEVMGSNPVQACIFFFQAVISQLLKLCASLRWSIISSYYSPQFKYMSFHIFTCILHLLWVYYKLTTRPAPSWLDSSVGRALHGYGRGHGFKSRSGLDVSRALISQLLKLCA